MFAKMFRPQILLVVMLCLVVIECSPRRPAKKGDPDFFEWEEHPEDDAWPSPYEGLRTKSKQPSLLADFLGILSLASSAAQRENARNDVNTPLGQVLDLWAFNQNGARSKNPGSLYRQRPK